MMASIMVGATTTTMVETVATWSLFVVVAPASVGVVVLDNHVWFVVAHVVLVGGDPVAFPATLAAAAAVALVSIVFDVVVLLLSCCHHRHQKHQQ